MASTPPPSKRGPSELGSLGTSPLKVSRTGRGAGRALAPAAALALDASESELGLLFDHYGVPEKSRELLLPVLRRWGRARWPQVLGLWTFLGDGLTKPEGTSTLQVWGGAGSGKTAVVSDYLNELRIRHVTLNAAFFTSIGELHTRLVRDLSRVAGDATGQDMSAFDGSASARRPRALDCLETAIRPSLQALASQKQGPKEERGSVAVVVVFEHAQELPRLGTSELELLTKLPEVLKLGNALSVVFVSRLPLVQLGLLAAREPPAIVFPTYSESEAENALAVALQRTDSFGTLAEIQKKLKNSGLVKFAALSLGRDLRKLMSVAVELLQEGAGEKADPTRVQQAVQTRHDLGLAGAEGHNGLASTAAVLGRMTRAEKRLVVAAFLASRVAPEDDQRLFLSMERRKRCRPTARAKLAEEEQVPVNCRAPRPAVYSRVLAVYHVLARQENLVNAALLEHLASHREAGLLSFVGASASVADQEPKIVSRASVTLALACARELGVDLAEYLCQH